MINAIGVNTPTRETTNWPSNGLKWSLILSSAWETFHSLFVPFAWGNGISLTRQVTSDNPEMLPGKRWKVIQSPPTWARVQRTQWPNDWSHRPIAGLALGQRLLVAEHHPRRIAQGHCWFLLHRLLPDRPTPSEGKAVTSILYTLDDRWSISNSCDTDIYIIIINYRNDNISR